MEMTANKNHAVLDLLWLSAFQGTVDMLPDSRFSHMCHPFCVMYRTVLQTLYVLLGASPIHIFRGRSKFDTDVFMLFH